MISKPYARVLRAFRPITSCEVRDSKPLYALPAWGRFQVLSEADKMARAKAEREARYWLLK